jgi:hypothetical protein
MKFMCRIVIAFICLAPCSAAIADAKSEITMALDYFAEVWNEGDIETIRGYYHPDFVLITSEGTISLGQRIEDLQSVAKAGEDRGELRHSQVQVQALEKDHAMAYGELTLKFKDGSAINTWFTTIYEKTPFGWKAILTHN